MINVKPKQGLRVLNETTGAPIPESGAQVPETSYYKRRIKDGDLLVIQPSKQIEIEKEQEDV